MLKQDLTGSEFLRHPQASRVLGREEEWHAGESCRVLDKDSCLLLFFFIVFWLNHHILLALPGKQSASRLLLNLPKTAPPLHGPIAAEE